MHDRLLVTEIVRKGEPQSELPAKKKLVPAMGAQENARISNCERERESEEEGHEANPERLEFGVFSPFEALIEVEPHGNGGAHGEETMAAGVAELGSTVVGFNGIGSPERSFLVKPELCHVHHEHHGRDHHDVKERVHPVPIDQVHYEGR